MSIRGLINLAVIVIVNINKCTCLSMFVSSNRRTLVVSILMYGTLVVSVLMYGTLVVSVFMYGTCIARYLRMINKLFFYRFRISPSRLQYYV